MGDRANIRTFEDGNGEIYFYTHWRGSELKQILQNALVRGRDRWDDSPYLNRVIFSEMIKDNVLGNTGYGISTFMCDNDHPIINVDLGKQTVEIDGMMWTFEQYVAQTFRGGLNATSR